MAILGRSWQEAYSPQSVFGQPALPYLVELGTSRLSSYWWYQCAHSDSTEDVLGGYSMKRLLLALAAVTLLGSPWLIGISAAGDTRVMTRTGTINPMALRQMLNKGLKATREEEKLYIDRVVQLVVLEKLPLSYVYASFDYARKRRPDYPFPYFRYSLKTLGKRKDIDL
jgi:hypothetical protein